MPELEHLLDPTGNSDQAANTTLAPRPGTLTGLTIGLLDNTKPNATNLLRHVAGELQARHGTGQVREYAKDYFGTPMTEQVLNTLKAECDLVITAVGDCGSCSAATVADGIMLERAGIPAVAIVSDSFLVSGRAMAQLQGFSGYEFVAVRHPVASCDETELRQRVLEVLPDIQRILGLEN